MHISSISTPSAKSLKPHSSGLQLKSPNNSQTQALDDFQGHHIPAVRFNGATEDIYGFDEFGRTPLMRAAEAGNIKEIKSLLKKGANVNSIVQDDSKYLGQGIMGKTSLHFAAENGQLEAVKILIEAFKKTGANIDQGDLSDASPLIEAAKSGHIPVVEALVECGADINKIQESRFGSVLCQLESHARNYDGMFPLDCKLDLQSLNSMIKRLKELGAKNMSHSLSNIPNSALLPRINSAPYQDTPLYKATERGDLATINSLLLTNLEQVNIANPVGLTPVWIAARKGHAEIIKALFDKGADINLPNSSGITPIHAAVKAGQTEAVKVLGSLGADLSKADKKGQTPLHTAEKNSNQEMIQALKNAFYDQKLGSAAEKKDVEAIKKLLLEARHYTTLLSTDDNQTTPINLAASRGYNGMVQAWAVMNKDRLNEIDSYGVNPIHAAAENGQMDTVEVLAKLKPKLLTQTDFEGNTVLHTAASSGHTEILKLLDDPKYKLDFNLKNNQGYTPLMLAAVNGQIETLGLLRGKSDIKQLDDIGWQPLHVVARSGDVNKMKSQIKSGMDVNALTATGKTPLYLAAENGHTKMAELLIASGADINSQAYDGTTPAHVAAKNGYLELAEHLQTHSIKRWKQEHPTSCDVKSYSNYFSTDFFSAYQAALKRVTKSEPRILSGEEFLTTELELKLRKKYPALQVAYDECLHNMQSAANEVAEMASQTTSFKAAAYNAIRKGLKKEVDAKHLEPNINNKKEAQWESTDTFKIVVPNDSENFKIHLGDIEVLELREEEADKIISAIRDNKDLEHAIKSNRSPKSINWPGKYGYTPLTFAASQGNIKAMNILLKLQANPDQTDKHGLTAFAIAAANDQREIVKMLNPQSISGIERVENWLHPKQLPNKNGNASPTQALAKLETEEADYIHNSQTVATQNSVLDAIDTDLTGDAYKKIRKANQIEKHIRAGNAKGTVHKESSDTYKSVVTAAEHENASENAMALHSPLSLPSEQPYDFTKTKSTAESERKSRDKNPKFKIKDADKISRMPIIPESDYEPESKLKSGKSSFLDSDNESESEFNSKRNPNYKVKASVKIIETRCHKKPAAQTEAPVNESKDADKLVAPSPQLENAETSTMESPPKKEPLPLKQKIFKSIDGSDKSALEKALQKKSNLSAFETAEVASERSGFSESILSNDSMSQRTIAPERPGIDASIFSHDSTSGRSIAPERPGLDASIFSNDSRSKRSIASERTVPHHATSSSQASASGIRISFQERAVSEAIAEEVFKLVYQHNRSLTRPEAQDIHNRLNWDVALHLIQLFQEHKVPEDEVSQISLYQRTASQGNHRLSAFWRAFDTNYPWSDY